MHLVGQFESGIAIPGCPRLREGLCQDSILDLERSAGQAILPDRVRVGMPHPVKLTHQSQAQHHGDIAQSNEPFERLFTLLVHAVSSGFSSLCATSAPCARSAGVENSANALTATQGVAVGTATKSQVRMERTPTARTTRAHRNPGVNFEEIATLRVLLRFLRSFPATRVFRGRLAHFLGLFSTANQDQFGYSGVWCVPS